MNALGAAVLGWARAHRRAALLVVVGAAAVLALGLVSAVRSALGLGTPSFEDVRASSSVYAQVEVVRTVETVRTEVKWRTRDVSVQRFDPQTGRLVYSLGSHDVANSQGTTRTDETVRERDVVVRKDDVERVVKASEHPWDVRAGIGLSSSGVLAGSVGASRTIIGPLTLGLEAQFPVNGPGHFAALLTVGLRL